MPKKVEIFTVPSYCFDIFEKQLKTNCCSCFEGFWINKITIENKKKSCLIILVLYMFFN